MSSSVEEPASPALPIRRTIPTAPFREGRDTDSNSHRATGESGYVQRRSVVSVRLYDDFNVLVQLHEKAEKSFN
jgi:hypothetical protein